MQGRPDQNGGPWDRPSEPRIPSINGTSKHRAIPQRPPGMTRLDTAPAMQRVPRPKRQAPPSKKVRRRFVVLGSLFVVAAIFACTVGYLFASGLLASTGPSTTSTDFLNALSTKNYDQAYGDLGPAIRIHSSNQQFIQQAQTLERCYGPISNYAEVKNSAIVQGNSQSYTYTISRSKLQQSYQMHITLQQDPDDGNSWKISDYGNNLGPGPGAPACK